MSSDNLDSLESTQFKASLKQFEFRAESSTSPLRKFLRKQQTNPDIQESTPLSSPRKRKSAQSIHENSDLEESSPSSPSKTKSRSQKRKKGYAPPEEYAHLRELNDCIKLHLDGNFANNKTLLCH